VSRIKATDQKEPLRYEDGMEEQGKEHKIWLIDEQQDELLRKHKELNTKSSYLRDNEPSEESNYPLKRKLNT
jgi:hypothetical protein